MIINQNLSEMFRKEIIINNSYSALSFVFNDPPLIEIIILLLDCIKHV